MVLSASQWYNNVCALVEVRRCRSCAKTQMKCSGLGLACVWAFRDSAGSSYFGPSTDTTNSAMCKLWYVLQWQHDWAIWASLRSEKVNSKNGSQNENILHAYMIEYLRGRCFSVPTPDLLLLLKAAAIDWGFNFVKDRSDLHLQWKTQARVSGKLVRSVKRHGGSAQEAAQKPEKLKSA